MLSALDTAIIFAYLLLMIAVGLYASRKQHSVEDFFVAGGKLGTVSIACEQMAMRQSCTWRSMVCPRSQD